MRKKELKRNKENRTKTRELATLKQDTGSLEAEVRRLTQQQTNSTLDPASQAKLKAAQDELDRIKKAKADYVQANPGTEDLVYRREKEREKARQQEEQDRQKAAKRAGPGVAIYGERSVFYHPVLNPLGHPPPGMWDQENPALAAHNRASSSKSSSDEEDDSDDEIVMPDGPNPHANKDGDSDEDSDEFELPEGPPPPEARLVPPPPPTLHRPSGSIMTPAGPMIHGPPTQGYPPHQGYGHPPPPPGFFPRPHPSNRPPRQGPPGSLPNRPDSHIQGDPLSGIPHQTYQAHRAGLSESKSPLSKPTPQPAPSGNSASAAASATIEAAPEIRDFRKEAAVFVPRAAKKKKPGLAPKIDAAPVYEQSITETATSNNNSMVEDTHDPPGQPVAASSDQSLAASSYNSNGYGYASADAGGGLLGKLSSVLGRPPLAPAPAATSTEQGKGKDDYAKFLNGLNGLQ